MLTPEEARSLLLRLAEDFETDLTAEGVDDFYDEIIALEVDDDALLEVTIRDERREVPVLVEFFRHDGDADELLLVVPPRIVSQVQGTIASVAPDAEVKVIPGS